MDKIERSYCVDDDVELCFSYCCLDCEEAFAEFSVFFLGDAQRALVSR